MMSKQTNSTRPKAMDKEGLRTFSVQMKKLSDSLDILRNEVLIVVPILNNVCDRISKLIKSEDEE